MIEPDELAICKRRGHDGPVFGEGWVQCRWCGMWRRHVVEEREDEPPEEELSTGVRTDRALDRLKQNMERVNIAPSKKKRKKKQK